MRVVFQSISGPYSEQEPTSTVSYFVRSMNVSVMGQKNKGAEFVIVLVIWVWWKLSWKLGNCTEKEVRLQNHSLRTSKVTEIQFQWYYQSGFLYLLWIITFFICLGKCKRESGSWCEVPGEYHWGQKGAWELYVPTICQARVRGGKGMGVHLYCAKTDCRPLVTCAVSR